MSNPAEAAAYPAPPGFLAARPARRDRTLLAIVVLALLALGSSIALLPGSGERAEGLMADGRYADAISTLLAVEDHRPLDAYEGYLLFKLYMLTKQPQDAAKLLAREPALLANNAGVLRALSDLFREQRDIGGETATLRQLFELNPTNADFLRLRSLYRLAGDTAGEASLLARALAAGQSGPADAARLAYLETLPSHGGKAALWVAPAGRFGSLATPAPDFSSSTSFPATASD